MALSSSGNCQESVSLESSVHSMTSSSSPLMKSIIPIVASLLRRNALRVFFEPPCNRCQPGADKVSRRHILEPDLAIGNARKGTFRLPACAQQLDRQRRIDRLMCAIFSLLKLCHQLLCLLHVQHGQRRSAMQTHGALAQVDRTTAVGTIHGPDVLPQLGDLLRRQRTNEVLLA